ncbi:hypothetical protein [Pseudaestuariivita atlantica]|uniref:Uncharacterized protein n=1 Tax=Pseudaestuariivita atlantica TaxID=1317121 RepID=A0A0L1JR14_9RHOB|nr:hypothetical protein [Pseudaestuariivita atlantica]KNG93843.1 hypothetical protein ATO11_11795 [Pseudaestuariivita atlantica]
MITFWNTVLPLGVLAVLGLAVPYLLTPNETRSHRRVLVSVVASAGVLVLISAGMLVVLGREQFGALSEGGIGLMAEIALNGSWRFVLAWGPMLLLAWFGLSQRVEARRGEDLAREA